MILILCCCCYCTAWHFLSHLKRLFSSRPSSRVGSESWSSLDGWRGFLCLWMVAFHSFFYVGNFIRDQDMTDIGKSPALLILNLGFLPVDGFFVLTGFLIAYPLFREEVRRSKLLLEEKKHDAIEEKLHHHTIAGNTMISSASSIWKFDLKGFYYRRVTRMLPSYLLAIYLHCGLLFPNQIQHSMSLVRSEGFVRFMQRVLPGIENAPNSCTAEKLWTNLTWMNHLMPFGGCMGWTWSFALQFNFYLFFPLLWKWAHTRLTKQAIAIEKKTDSDSSESASISTRTPSQFVIPFLYVFLVVNLLVRIVSFFQIRLFDLRHEEGVFLGFFWYSNTLTRGAAIVYGVLIAHWMLTTNLVSYLKKHLSFVQLGWGLVALTVVLQMFWNRFFSDGNMVETPGWSAMNLTQIAGGETSMQSIFNPNPFAYWPHMLFHIFVLVGSPLSNFVFVFLLLVVVNRIGSLGEKLNAFLSHPIWYPISTLSWWVYLVHPALMIRFYAFYIEYIGEIPASVSSVFVNVVIQWILSFTTAIFMYTFFEMPMEIWLRQNEAVVASTQHHVPVKSASAAVADAAATTTPIVKSGATFFSRLSTGIFIYCVVCMAYIVLHHLGMLTAVSTLVPKPYV